MPGANPLARLELESRIQLPDTLARNADLPSQFGLGELDNRFSELLDLLNRSQRHGAVILHEGAAIDSLPA